MHKALAEIVEKVEADRAALASATDTLTQEQIDFRPAEDRWSVGENLDHLAKVEKGIARLIKMKVAEARGAEKPVVAVAAPSQLATLDRFDIPNNPRKMKVPDERLAPRRGVAKAELFDTLAASRRTLRESLDTLADYDLSVHTFPHPLFGEINLYQWVLFIGQHERRHLNQINSVFSDSRFPAASEAVVKG